MANKIEAALRLADEAEHFDLALYESPARAAAVMSGMLQDCADDIRWLCAVNQELVKQLSIAAAISEGEYTEDQHEELGVGDMYRAIAKATGEQA